MSDSSSGRLVGLVAGVAAVALALTPSLVPRPALFQGFLAGLSFALAYFAATWLASIVLKALGRRRIPAVARKLTLRPWAWLVVAGLGALYLAVVGTLAVSWQNDVRANVDMPPVDGVDLVTFFLVAVAAAAVAFGVRWGLKRLAALGRMWAGKSGAAPRLARGTGLLTGALGALLALTLLVSVALAGTGKVYADRNNTTPAGIMEPDSTYRSAGPGSGVDWAKLGMQGRAFVGGGPTSEQIAAATGESAQQPVRVYVGSEQENSMEARAAVAVAELKRTGGFEREFLMIATPTGSGWLERAAVDSLEFLHGGNTAIVSMQYSYQPSWVSFLFHQDLPRDSGRALYSAVRAEWLTMPPADRPKLLVYGLSLGASGMQAAFTDGADLTDSVDGAVFSGAPNNSQPWGTFQAHRDAGTPVWQPVYDGGLHVRWLSKSGDFAKVQGPWETPRVAYLQHGTDAVTWLTPRLIWQQPEWLAGPAATGGRAPDVSDSMRWIPLVTYLQVAFDMFMGEAVPANHGHNFGAVAVEAWNHVAPSRLDDPALGRIQGIIATYPYEDSMDN